MMGLLNHPLAVGAAAALITYMLATLYWRVAVYLDFLEHPNHRSSHSAPTPSGAGVVFLLVYVAGVALLSDRADLPVLMLPVLVGLIGLADDFFSLGVVPRILGYLVATVLLFWLMPELPALEIFGWRIQTPYLLLPLFALAMLWLINLYNFMDGINGIATVEALFVLFGLALLGEEWRHSVIVYLSAGILIGFLPVNFPVAKAFMGDVGSTFLGSLLGVMVLLNAVEGGVSLYAGVILLGCFVVDASVTLYRRWRRGDRWFEAHRSHAYQVLSRRWGGHGQVVAAMVVINLLWLLPLSWGADRYPQWGILFLLVAYTPLVVLVTAVGAGKPQ